MEENRGFTFAGRIGWCRMCGRAFGSFSVTEDLCGTCSPKHRPYGTYVGHDEYLGNGTACGDVAKFMNRVEITRG